MMSLKKVNVKENITSFVKGILFLFKFQILLLFVFLRFILQQDNNNNGTEKKRFRINLKPLENGYEKIYNKVLLTFDKAKVGEIRFSELIFLSLRNLKAKRSRTNLTVGGMAIGFGAIIFLLSLGYGFERLVISKVANLNELKQIDVSTTASRPLNFNTETIENMNNIEKVKDVIPIITCVSKVNYNNSVSDVIVYGVNSKYLEETQMHTLKGDLFEEGDMKTTIIQDGNKIAGASLTLIENDSLGQEISDINYSIYPETWKPVYSEPTTDSIILGYTKREPGQQDGVEVWGESYLASNIIMEAKDVKGNNYTSWIKGTFSLWKQEICSDADLDCIEGSYKIIRESDSQIIKQGYITEDKVSFDRLNINKIGSMNIYNGKIIDPVDFKINSGSIFAYTSMNSEEDSILIENNDTESLIKGELLLGQSYGSNSYIIDDNGNRYNYWIRSKMDLYQIKIEEGKPTYSNEFITGSIKETLEIYIKSSDTNILNNQNVLGAETVNENYIDLESLKTEDDGIDWVSLQEELGTVPESEKEVVKINETAQKVAIVNTSMLTILGLTADEAIGEEFEAGFVFDSALFNKSNVNIESELITVKIIGIISDSKSPTFYTPINDVKVEGMENVSQLKVIASDTADVEGIRDNIEALGFQTKSVLDTVQNINSLFDSLRIILLILGLIALGVASLGMFNTLTVSLLEKTREVGLLKTMGLKSSEVKVVFLSESMIMSVLGGVIGLFIAFLGGEVISILLTILSASQGLGSLSVSYIPSELSISIFVISVIVGLVTGWYPAKRARKISALHALRYE